MSNRILKHLPYFERGVAEFQKIADAEVAELVRAEAQKDKILANQFVRTADIQGIEMFEELYNIVPESTDTLEFRRERILNRMALLPPFTERFLRQLLDRFIGENAYTLIVDYNNYIIYINYGSIDQDTEKEISIVIDKVKPSNMVFITEPLLTYRLLQNETISIIPEIFYRLGTSWVLGARPFKALDTKEVFKLPNVNSITNDLLTDTANFVEGQIAKVIINGTVTINTFTTKQVTDSTVELEYEVTNAMGVNTITRIQICKADDTSLTDVTVYVPVVGSALINHKIEVKEGV